MVHVKKFCNELDLQDHQAFTMNGYIYLVITGLEKLGFLVNETPCSSKQVQEHVLPQVILCSL